jgi:hypothetical protein
MTSSQTAKFARHARQAKAYWERKGAKPAAPQAGLPARRYPPYAGASGVKVKATPFMQ